MGKIKKMVLGMVLAVSVFGSSISLCHAASSSIDVGITATNAWGSFMYDEPGHHLKVTVYYLERKADGKLQMGEASAHSLAILSLYMSQDPVRVDVNMRTAMRQAMWMTFRGHHRQGYT